MIDIYEAAGGKANEDRTQVSLPQIPKPFDITLRVVPTGIKMDYEGERVTFAILLSDKHVIDGPTVRFVTYDEEVTLPVEQVRIASRE